MFEITLPTDPLSLTAIGAGCTLALFAIGGFHLYMGLLFRPEPPRWWWPGARVLYIVLGAVLVYTAIGLAYLLSYLIYLYVRYVWLA